MKSLIALMLALSLLLCGCGTGDPTPSADATAAPTEPTELTDGPTEPSTEPPTEPPTEPQPQYRNPLTGEKLFDPVTTRIISLSIGNSSDAMPTYGLSQSDMIFEMYVNGWTTRLLALYTDPSQVETIGSIRSQRYHFTDIAHSYDTIAISAGGSNVVMRDVTQSGIDYMNVDTKTSTGYSFRNMDRKNSGFSWEHCLFAYGPGLYEYARSKGFSTAMDQEKDYALRFAEDKALTEGQSASTVTVTFRIASVSKNSVFNYDAESGLYRFNQYKKDMVDAGNDLPVAFRNVFVILAETRTEDEYHVSNLIGSGEGYFACDGFMIPILWHRATEDDPFSFTHTDGTQLEQGVGSSYIAICPTQSGVSAE